MIRVRDLTVVLEGRTVLDRVSLEVGTGRLLALVGPSGCGKSVLLKTLAGLLPIAGGEVEIAGEAVHGRSEPALFEVRRRIGMLFQGGALFDGLRVLDNVAFPLLRRGESEGSARAAARAALARVGLAEAAALHPDQLSGGMRKRVGLARALIAAPEAALYDEPTAGLDPVTSAQILRILTEARDQREVTGIAAGHEVDTLLPACDDIAMLDGGRVVHLGEVARLETDAPPALRAFLGPAERAA